MFPNVTTKQVKLSNYNEPKPCHLAKWTNQDIFMSPEIILGHEIPSVIIKANGIYNTIFHFTDPFAVSVVSLED